MVVVVVVEGEEMSAEEEDVANVANVAPLIPDY